MGISATVQMLAYVGQVMLTYLQLPETSTLGARTLYSLLIDSIDLCKHFVRKTKQQITFFFPVLQSG